MNNSRKNLYNPIFSHIYIEKEAYNHPNTKKILDNFKNSRIIEIAHYKEVFNRSRQNFVQQKNSPSLILAVKNSGFLYEGAPVCQDFGNSHFYYTSCAMNCFYDCEYCYLQGMYPSANIVVFVNLEEIFEEIKKVLLKHPVYLCISYDTDLLALESILHYSAKWLEFCRVNPALTVEIRTKSANLNFINDNRPCNNFILAWTLSPAAIINSYEHHTPSLDARLACIKRAIDKGFLVRLCFDPLIYENNWKELYMDFIPDIFKLIPPDNVKDVSLGVFRISKDYLKNMKKQRKHSLITLYPYEMSEGVYHYGSISKEMITYVKELLLEWMPADKIFIWKEGT